MRPEGPLSAQPGRKVADCRSIPSEINCSLTFSGPEEEVVKVVTEHAVEDHHEPYSPELVKMIRDGLVDETRFQESAPAPGP
ncbi:MAG: DUF1059 domain-containing protein [Deltaproteobacteria bacterium]|nr:DUF1059 domain-containing protein [Deltaproteobacteria bacterium]